MKPSYNHCACCSTALGAELRLLLVRGVDLQFSESSSFLDVNHMHMINFELLILLKFHIWGHTNNIGLIQSYQIYKVQTVVKIASVVFFMASM